MMDILIKKGNLETGVQRGRSPLYMKTEIRVMLLQAKECQRMLTSLWKLTERTGTGSPS